MPAAIPELHLICLDHPFPPHYGGVIDIYYKWKALTDLGIRPAVHIFHKPDRRPEQPDLPYHSLHFYERKTGGKSLLTPRPYIIASRDSSELFDRLRADHAPILFEGVHALAVLPALKKKFPQRKAFVRVHNIEQHYYAELFHRETRLKKKLFFASEMLKLKRYELQYLNLADSLFPLSELETRFLTQKGLPAEWIPAFLPEVFPIKRNINEPFKILFHANFEVSENVRSAEWLLRHIVPHLPHKVKLILAGKNADQFRCSHPSEFLFPNPQNMNKIIAEADAVVLPIHQTSGVKLKTLISLAHRKITLVTPAGIQGTGLQNELQNLHWIFEGEQQLSASILRLTENGFQLPAEAEQLWNKFDLLYNNNSNAQRLLNRILNKSF